MSSLCQTTLADQENIARGTRQEFFDYPEITGNEIFRVYQACCIGSIQTA